MTQSFHKKKKTKLIIKEYGQFPIRHLHIQKRAGPTDTSNAHIGTRAKVIGRDPTLPRGR